VGTLAVFLTASNAAVRLATYNLPPLEPHNILDYFDSSESQEQETVQPKAKAATKVEQPHGDMSTTDPSPQQQTQMNLDELKPASDPQPGAMFEVSLFSSSSLVFHFI